MPYEVVDPAEREERGVIHRTLTAAMVNAGPALEVWELADDEAQTRMVMCWPDPEFQGGATGSEERIKHFVREQAGRPEREATAILAEHNPVPPNRVHELVALAWARGFVAGFTQGGETFAAVLERIAGGDPS